MKQRNTMHNYSHRIPSIDLLVLFSGRSSEGYPNIFEPNYTKVNSLRKVMIAFLLSSDMHKSNISAACSQVTDNLQLYQARHRPSGVEEGAQPPSCDLKGHNPPNSANFFGNKSI